MADGWADWGSTSTKAPDIPGGRYCPRCDRLTAWTRGIDPDRPELPGCECGFTVASELSLDELDNVRRHYGLTVTNIDDMVGLPAPERI